MNEISHEKLSEFEKRYRATVFIVLAQICFTFMLIAAAFLIVSKIESSDPEQNLSTLWVAVIFIAIGSFVLRRLFFNWERLKNIALLKGFSGLLKSLQTNTIILGGIAEIIVVIGLIISVYSANSFDILRAGAVALVVFLINFPRKNVWMKIMTNLENV
jgi:hypothetical protein